MLASCTFFDQKYNRKRRLDMDAKALITREDQSFAIEDVRLPDVQPDEIGIKV